MIRLLLACLLTAMSIPSQAFVKEIYILSLGAGRKSVDEFTIDPATVKQLKNSVAEKYSIDTKDIFVVAGKKTLDSKRIFEPLDDDKPINKTSEYTLLINEHSASEILVEMVNLGKEQLIKNVPQILTGENLIKIIEEKIENIKIPKVSFAGKSIGPNQLFYVGNGVKLPVIAKNLKEFTIVPGIATKKFEIGSNTTVAALKDSVAKDYTIDKKNIFVALRGGPIYQPLEDNELIQESKNYTIALKNSTEKTAEILIKVIKLGKDDEAYFIKVPRIVTGQELIQAINKRLKADCRVIAYGYEIQANGLINASVFSDPFFVVIKTQQPLEIDVNTTLTKLAQDFNSLAASL